MIADPFHHRAHAAVADAKALARHAADIRFAAGRAIKRDVADDDVFFGDERSSPPADRQ